MTNLEYARAVMDGEQQHNRNTPFRVVVKFACFFFGVVTVILLAVWR